VTGIEVIIGNYLPLYLAPLSKYSASKIMGLRPWPFRVTWRHRSRDYSSPGVDFLCVVHSYHASTCYRYRDMAVWISSRKALPGTEVGRRSVHNITLNHWSHILLFATLKMR